MRTRIIGIVVAVVLALGGMVVLLGYVGGADSRAMAQIKTVPVYVVKSVVPAGTPASRIGAFITTQQVPAVGAVPDRVQNLSDVAGQVTTTKLEAGEQLLKARFAKPRAAVSGTEGLAIPKGFEALTVALPPERELGAKISVGDRVGVIATTGQPGGGNGLARQIVQKVLVLNVQAPKTGTNTSSNTNTTVTVTLALQRPDAELVAWDQQNGSIYLALQPPAALEGGRTVNLKVVFP